MVLKMTEYKRTLASSVVKFNNYISKYRVAKNYNFLDLGGGKYNFKKDFVDLYINTYFKFQKERHPCLAFKVLNPNDFMFYLDFDFRSNGPMDIASDELVKIAEDVLYCLNEVKGCCGERLDIILTRRISTYKKKGVLKNGFHMYIPNLRTSKSEMAQVKNLLINKGLGRLLQFVKKHNITNSLNDIVDDGIVKRKNGLILIGINYHVVVPHTIFVSQPEIYILCGVQRMF